LMHAWPFWRNTRLADRNPLPRVKLPPPS